MGARRIEVNIPDFSVEVFDGDTVVHSARVVVGKPETPTPVFSNVMRYVLINPSWQVPDSIIKKEILPRLEPFRAPRLRSEDDRRTGHRAPAAGRRQRARAARLHVPERSFGLPARHAGARAVLRGHAGAQPRLRARRRPVAARRTGARMAGEPDRARRSAARSARSSCRSRCRSTSNTSPNSSTRTGSAGEARRLRPDAKGRRHIVGNRQD